ncbi:MAG: hypothetical protein UT61_C0021G0013 [Candidatus Woesebacteria bacterium GW2011_GWA1_39_8]|uniref:Uncharacterized protein n=1 Tax=Candidatus Woesebacteria bacterium GW2011_GWA1_39_8 TaxID=1618552 RepID=A0A0G0SW39_9BACT|nr:MAG: hypothetical protein UT61_C0021G0013 [Candidatus Woesebacteria bacterium GW2011_GWA1_39_8]
MSIFVNTRVEFQLTDFHNLPCGDVEWPTIPPGRYELERVSNPYSTDSNWLVLKGTKTGMSEEGWKKLFTEKAGNRQITLEEV